MDIDFKSIDRFLDGRCGPEEMVEVLAAIAVNPELEEYLVTKKRMLYTERQLEEYGSFIPAGSVAADDGKNLCDLQCELFILKEEGKDAGEEDVAGESRSNYWLRKEGTPLFNMGKLLELKGFLVNRVYESDMDRLREYVREYHVIAVVNGDVLENRVPDILSPDFSLASSPNHAVVVLGVSEEDETVRLFNPAREVPVGDYPMKDFADAWKESRNYIVLVREKKTPYEYNPQPLDLSGVSLDPEMEKLTEMIAEHVHDIWAVSRLSEGIKYGPVRDETHNPDLLPYFMLPQEEKDYDRRMAINAIKLAKRLGYRLVDVKGMYVCPDCGEALEPSFHFCPNCGHRLTWEDFK